LATTAPSTVKDKIADHLEQFYGASVVGVSSSLSNRSILRQDIRAADGKFSVLLTELKAAAVDVVTSVGLEVGLDVVYMDNEPIAVGGDGELDPLLLQVGEEAKQGFKRGRDN